MFDIKKHIVGFAIGAFTNYLHIEILDTYHQ